jgi:general secretion pathway protein L
MSWLVSDLVALTLKGPRSFLDWWLGELAGLLPGWLKRGRSGGRKCLLLALGPGGSRVIERTTAGETVLGTIEDEGEAGAGALAGLAGQGRYRSWPLVVRLDPALGLRKEIELPLAAQGDLGRLLGYELDRLTPFKAEDVSYAYEVRASDARSKKLKVGLEMAPKAVVERALALAAAGGLKVDRLELAPRPGGSALDLLPREVVPGRERRWPQRVLPLLAVVLALVAIAIPFRQQQTLIEQLNEQVAALRPQAEATLALRQELDRLVEDNRFLVEGKQSRATMTELLAELTRLIPDEAFITQFQIQDGEIQLHGLAAKASDLIAILEQSALLTAPQFRAPVTRDARTDQERFHIGARLDGRSG